MPLYWAKKDVAADESRIKARRTVVGKNRTLQVPTGNLNLIGDGALCDRPISIDGTTTSPICPVFCAHTSLRLIARLGLGTEVCDSRQQRL
ncbi:unnamed protein product [Rhizoctonia solani]|uniref:Uncharacterized protein n=1 Tax=Rhizoctonia solani TaxID=456999 RepID=A0A8H2W9W1_9AGAM|nr:unnamed protein product [Rhizoctonia solani]